jgi:hypothetical protein
MTLGWDNVSELRPPTDLLFIEKMMHKYEAVVEWYWYAKPKNPEKTLFQLYFVHHKSHMNWTWREPRSQR